MQVKPKTHTKLSKEVVGALKLRAGKWMELTGGRYKCKRASHQISEPHEVSSGVGRTTDLKEVFNIPHMSCTYTFSWWGYSLTLLEETKHCLKETVKKSCLYINYDRGQKCWDLSTDITTTSDSSPPTPIKVEFCSKWVEMSAFLATTLLEGVGGWQDEPKVKPKIVIRSKVLYNNYLEGLFHTVPSSFVLHCRT